MEVGGGFCLGGLLSLCIQERLSGDSALSGRAPVASSTLGEAMEVIKLHQSVGGNGKLSSSQACTEGGKEETLAELIWFQTFASLIWMYVVSVMGWLTWLWWGGC